MFDNNPFRDGKNYWKSYYMTITEGWNDEVEDATGYKWIEKDHEQYDPKYDPDGHGHHFYNEETGEKMSQDEVMKLYDSKKNKNREDSAAGPNPSDWDARKQGEESTHSEEVEHDGEQLDEAGRFTTKTPRVNRYTSRASLERGDRARGIEGGLPGPDDSAYGRARMRSSNTEGKMKKLEAKDRGSMTMFDREFGGFRSRTRNESLFHKDSDRLLREHIRAEYEERGIYPTTREVQETYNMVMDLLEKTSASKRDEILAQQHGTSGTETGLKLTKQELRRRRAGNSPQDYGDPARTSREEGERQGAHAAKRGKKTKISPSSPARKQSEVEQDTRFLMGQGFSPSHLRRIMSDSGR